MPGRCNIAIHDHVCLNCGHEEINKRRTVADIEAGITCPKCGAKMQQRFDDAVGFILKPGGVGWCKNGYNGGNR